MITVQIQKESGERIGPQIYIGEEVFPTEDDTRFNLLRFIDPYGDTVFNQVQCAALIHELELLETLSPSSEWRDALRLIKQMAAECQSEPHRYLKLIGD